MVEQLFGSKTRVKLLHLFYSNPNRSFYVREITRKIDEQINSVRRELANLLNAGIISSDTTNNRLYYEVDQKYEFYEPLSTIFGGKAAKTTGKVATKKSASTQAGTTDAKVDSTLKTLGNVDLLLYTGQFTRDDRSGIDLLLVGDINSTQLGKYMDDLEKKEAKEIRYVVMDLAEFKYRNQVKDRFLSEVLASKYQVVHEKDGLLESISK